MAGIYIHIPFCKQRCTYCDFHFSTTYSSYRERMIDNLIQELNIRKGYLLNESIETIYLGGGTPSLLSKKELNRILSTIYSNYNVVEKVECTLEANPDDITIYKAKEWLNEGVNRLSIGLQSFKQADLDWMNRAHNEDESLESVLIAKRAGFTNITVDLMYGLPDLSLEEWNKHIDIVLDLGVQHISAYCLTVEPKTVLSNWVKNNKIAAANEDQQSEQFLHLVEKLEAAHFNQYEISNFGLNGNESKHNSNYWKGQTYLGIGPSAHSFNGFQRDWNVSNNQTYMKAMEQQERCFETEVLSSENRYNELIMTGLRTAYGVDLKQLNSILSADEEFKLKVSGFIKNDWMIKSPTHIFLTKEGRLRADYIASELFKS